MVVAGLEVVAVDLEWVDVDLEFAGSEWVALTVADLEFVDVELAVLEWVIFEFVVLEFAVFEFVVLESGLAPLAAVMVDVGFLAFPRGLELAAGCIRAGAGWDALPGLTVSR